MKNSILYEEGYEYNSDTTENNLNLHLDYGKRFHEINMDFQHFHSFYEIYVLLNGRSQHIIEGRAYELNEFDFVLLTPYQLHKTNYYKNLPCCRLILTFDMNLFESLFPSAAKEVQQLFQQQPPIFRFDEELTNTFIQRFNTMFLASKNTHSMTDPLMTSYFIQFFHQFTQEKHNNIYLTKDLEDSTKGKIHEIVSYIHTHYSEELTLDFFSKTFFISPHYLSKQFKLITLFNLIDYIHHTRVKRAQELLLNTNLKVIEIIEQCGFGSLSQFNRVFNSITHTAPTTYRKTYKLSTSESKGVFLQRI